MKKTGQMLKEGREKLQLTISEISLATKINPRVLQSMEAGEMDKLPAISFLRGFIRTYATHLKLDGDVLLNQFNEELKNETTKPLPPAPNETPPANPESASTDHQEPTTTLHQEAKHSRTHRTWHSKIPLLRNSSLTTKSLSAAGIIILILIIIGIRGLIKKYEKESSRGEAPEVLSVLTTPEHLSVKPEKAKSEKPEKSEKTESPAQQPIHSSTSATESTPAATPAATPSTTPSPNEPKKDLKVPPPAASLETTAQPPEPETIPKKEKPIESGPQEIILEALDKVEINFRIDEGPLKKIILQPEQIHTIKGMHSIAIDLSDGGAVNVIHNGRDKGVPGDLGKPKKLKYP